MKIKKQIKIKNKYDIRRNFIIRFGVFKRTQEVNYTFEKEVSESESDDKSWIITKVKHYKFSEEE